MKTTRRITVQKRRSKNVLVVGTATLREAGLIESCEGCNPEAAEIPFDNILDRITGSDPSVRITFWKRRRSQTAGVSFSKRHSSSQGECLSQSFPLVRPLLGLGVRLRALH